MWYELLHFTTDTVYLNPAVVARVSQVLGDLFFLAASLFLVLVLVLGVLLFLAFRSR